MMINLWEYLNNFIYFIFLGDDLICIVVRKNMENLIRVL